MIKLSLLVLTIALVGMVAGQSSSSWTDLYSSLTRVNEFGNATQQLLVSRYYFRFERLQNATEQTNQSSTNLSEQNSFLTGDNDAITTEETASGPEDDSTRWLLIAARDNSDDDIDDDIDDIDDDDIIDDIDDDNTIDDDNDDNDNDDNDNDNDENDNEDLDDGNTVDDDDDFGSSGLDNDSQNQTVSNYSQYVIAARRIFRNRLPLDQSNDTSARPVFINVLLNKVDQPSEYDDPLKTSEAFELFVTEDGNVTIYAAGYVSFLRALETFTQLVQANGTISQLPIHILDYPSFSWRGVLLDVSRHYQSLDTIKRFIRGLEINKLNVLQLHLSDAESFPLQLQQFSEVTQSGAYSGRQTYSRRAIRELVQYASFYGVVIVPELSTPQHTASWTRSPQLSRLNACGGAPAADWRKYCDQPPCSQLDPTLNDTYLLVESVLSEAQDLFPAKYIHLGGDDVHNACWRYNENITEWMSDHNITTYPELFEYYFDKVNDFVGVDRRRIFQYWPAYQNLSYADGAILQFWGTENQYSQLENLTNDIILSTRNKLPLTAGEGSFAGNLRGLSQYQTWWDIYRFNTTKANLGDRLIGIVSPLSTEYTNENSLEHEAWPRGSALGLRLWNDHSPLNRTELVKNLIKINWHLEIADIEPAAVTTQYCERYPEACFFD